MLRRITDIAVSAAALTVLAPLLAVTALAIVLDSPGSPIYMAWRIGRGGRPFRMWKFRTMVPNAARLGGPITGAQDARITRLGRLLRATKIDELPQFVNVLLGDMTLVGPRPEAPEIVAVYTPEQQTILQFTPGMTGYVQLQSGCEADRIPEGVKADEYYVRHLMDHKLRLDLAYLTTRTPVSDFQIVLATAGLVFRSLVQR
jgi:lipopolysaccharide/colanic/teichoic acid biosynthesis glycosyltransferase